MSDLNPELISLDKGLSLQLPKLVAPSGTLLDSLNYEQVDFQGQKRIEGYTRYDGSAGAVFNEYYVLEVSAAINSIFVGALVINNVTKQVIGTLIATNELDTIVVFIINENLIPKVGDTVDFQDRNTPVGVLSILKGVDVDTPETHYANLLEYNSVARAKVESLPGKVAGLHWFRDRLYAVANLMAIELTNTIQLHPNDIVTKIDVNTNIANTQPTKVLDVFFNPTSTKQTILIASTDDWWSGNTRDTVQRNGVDVGLWLRQVLEPSIYPAIATFFEARNEAQVLLEDKALASYDFGWKLIDHGWAVNFINGKSLFGSLPSLNQNITGLGVQGPTNIGGNNGQPLVVTQKVNITNRQTQVKGWKDTQSPSNFELESDNLTEIDSTAIYADAYISWDGSTGVVTGDSGELIEYPASNSVVITFP